MKTPEPDDSASRKLIELAARITDLELGGANQTARWLRAFRKNFRHIAVTAGQSFGRDLGLAESATDAELERKAQEQAA